jgi:hypothetical protein
MLPPVLMMKIMRLQELPTRFQKSDAPPTTKEVLEGAQSYLYVLSTFLELARRVYAFRSDKMADRSRMGVLVGQLAAARADIDAQVGRWSELDIWPVLNETLFALDKDSAQYTELTKVSEELFRVQAEVRLVLGSIAAVH